MAKKYKQKDLGYPRKPTHDVLRVKFSNGETFDVPAQVIVDSRDENYADEQEDTAAFVADSRLSDYDITDWASNNMNWSDLAPYARKVKVPTPKFDYEDGWCDAELEVLE